MVRCRVTAWITWLEPSEERGRWKRWAQLGSGTRSHGNLWALLRTWAFALSEVVWQSEKWPPKVPLSQPPEPGHLWSCIAKGLYQRDLESQGAEIILDDQREPSVITWGSCVIMSRVVDILNLRCLLDVSLRKAPGQWGVELEEGGTYSWNPLLSLSESQDLFGTHICSE